MAKLESAVTLDSDVKPQEEQKTRGKQVDTREQLAEKVSDLYAVCVCGQAPKSIQWKENIYALFKAS